MGDTMDKSNRRTRCRLNGCWYILMAWTVGSHCMTRSLRPVDALLLPPTCGGWRHAGRSGRDSTWCWTRQHPSVSSSTCDNMFRSNDVLSPFHNNRMYASLPHDFDGYNNNIDPSQTSVSLLSLKQLLRFLDERRIRYPPTATRKDLEMLLLRTLEADRSQTRGSTNWMNTNDRSGHVSPTVYPANNLDKDLPNEYNSVDEQEYMKRRAHRRRQRQRRLWEEEQRRQRNNNNDNTILQPFSTWTQQIVTTVPQMASTIFDQAARKARRIRRRASEFWSLDDETGVRDVRYQYLRRQQQQQRRNQKRPQAPPTDRVETVPSPKVEVIVDDSDVDHHTDELIAPTPPYYSRATSSPSYARDKNQWTKRSTFVPRPLDDELDNNDNVDGFHVEDHVVPPAPPSSSRYTSSAPRRRRGDSMPYISPPPQRRPTQKDPYRPSQQRQQPRAQSETSGIVLRPMLDGVPQDPGQRPGRPHRPEKQQHRDSSSSSFPREANRRKKVYSPYSDARRGFWADPDSEYQLDEEPDVVDRVSNFLADAADSVMWGMFDSNPESRDSKTDRPNVEQSSNEVRKSPRLKANDPSQAPHQRRRHWKDRLEQRLDSMLGLHEDGMFYNRWTTQSINDDKQSVVGKKYDAFSVARGARRKRKPVYQKPFWEEDGNLFAILLGQTSSGGKDRILDNNRMGYESGSVLVVLRICLRTIASVGGYLCHWASTQGALPQPVVVGTVAASALCAVPRRRISTMVITLLGLRIIGEIVHSYTYGPAGWDEADYDDIDGDNRREQRVNGSETSDSSGIE